MSITKRLFTAALAVIFAISTFCMAVSPAAADTITVTMGAGGLKFKPKKIKASPGDTIEWVNGKLSPHNVVFTAKKGGSAELAAVMTNEELLKSEGDSYTTVIPGDAQPGTYEFYCKPHAGAGMKGKLKIE